MTKEKEKEEVPMTEVQGEKAIEKYSMRDGYISKTYYTH